MGETARIVSDSKGRSHYVMNKKYTMSCGPACVAMTEYYYFGQRQCAKTPEGRAQVLSQRYPGSFSLETGTRTENLYHVLNKEGIKSYWPTTMSQGKIFDYLYQYITDTTPAIAHTRWASGNGHFTVCRMIDSDHTVVFLDPEYGVVEVARQALPRYRTNGQLSGEFIFTHK